jgi:hypothetical protein
VCPGAREMSAGRPWVPTALVLVPRNAPFELRPSRRLPSRTMAARVPVGLQRAHHDLRPDQRPAPDHARRDHHLPRAGVRCRRPGRGQWVRNLRLAGGAMTTYRGRREACATDLDRYQRATFFRETPVLSRETSRSDAFIRIADGVDLDDPADAAGRSQSRNSTRFGESRPRLGQQSGSGSSDDNPQDEVHSSRPRLVSPMRP